MSLLTRETSLILWHDVVRDAERSCDIHLDAQLEAYLVSLLVRYTDKPELAKQVIATAFLEARQGENGASLQHVGDHCLLFAGLFPRIVERRHIKIAYFVNLGQSAYSAISATTNDVFACLAFQFVTAMDVLQSIRPLPELLPLEAYEQWQELGSKRALKVLQFYTPGTPIKNPKW